jgi:hypothetical protein
MQLAEGKTDLDAIPKPAIAKPTEKRSKEEKHFREQVITAD